MFKANLLRGKLAERGYTLTALAAEMGIVQSTLHRKMKCETEFDRPEILQIKEILNLSGEEVMAIFFAD